MRTMTETLSLEASIKLQSKMPEKTEYKWYIPHGWIRLVEWNENCWENWEDNQIYKTLTLTEAIDMLPETIKKDLRLWDSYCKIMKHNWLYVVSYWAIVEKEWIECIFAVEKMLLYLDKEWLLPNK